MKQALPSVTASIKVLTLKDLGASLGDIRERMEKNRDWLINTQGYTPMQAELRLSEFRAKEKELSEAYGDMKPLLRGGGMK